VLAACSNQVTERAESPTSKRAPDPVLTTVAPNGPACALNADCDGGTACTTAYPTGGGAHPAPAPPPSQCATNADCGSRARCIVTNKAAGDGCYTDGDCPQYHHCDRNYCFRMQCKTNLDCGDGFCVNRQCSARSGVCISMRIMQPA